METNSLDAAEAEKAIAINALAENFGKEFSPTLLGLWLDLLASYPVAMVWAAVKTVIEQYEFKTLPPFAVLKKSLDDLAGTSERAVALRAEAEWALLQENISRLGVYGQPVDMYPTTAHVLHVMGGWRAVCAWETRYLDLKRREFVELWTQADGKADVLAMGAVGVQQAITQTRGGFVRVGMVMPGELMSLGENRKQIGA